MSAWLWNFILGRGDPEPPQKPVEEYNPYNDRSLHNVSRIDEYTKIMWDNKRCFSCGEYFSTMDPWYGYCEFCRRGYNSAIKHHEGEILSKGLKVRDVTEHHYRLYHLVNKWYNDGDITENEAKGFAQKLLAEAQANHKKYEDADRQRDAKKANTSTARNLSNLV